MNVKNPIGQEASNFLKSHPVIAGVIGLAALIGIGLGIKSKIASS